MQNEAEVLMILVAGPFRSGTNDDPVLIHRNVEAMNQMALKVYQKGHLPVLGEWFALPLIETAGSKEMGDEIWDSMFQPVSIRMISKCDVVLRIGGPSKGSDEMVRIGKEKGKRIIYSLDELDQ